MRRQHTALTCVVGAFLRHTDRACELIAYEPSYAHDGCRTPGHRKHPGLRRAQHVDQAEGDGLRHRSAPNLLVHVRWRTVGSEGYEGYERLSCPTATWTASLVIGGKPPYPPQFRAKAIQLARTSERPRAQIAREWGVTGETLLDADSSRRIWTRGIATLDCRATHRRSCADCSARTLSCARSAKS